MDRNNDKTTETEKYLWKLNKMSAKHHSLTKYTVEEVTASSKVQSFSENTHQRNWVTQEGMHTTQAA